MKNHMTYLIPAALIIAVLLATTLGALMHSEETPAGYSVDGGGALADEQVACCDRGGETCYAAGAQSCEACLSWCG